MDITQDHPPFFLFDANGKPISLFPFRLENRTLRNLDEEGAKDIGFFPDVGLLSSDFKLERGSRNDLANEDEEEKKIKGKKTSFTVHLFRLFRL